MLTLNQLKYKLIGFFESHAQVKSVKYEDDFDFNAERNLTYPVVNIEYIDSNIADKMTSHNFKVVLGDLADGNVEGLDDEIVSDMHLIAEDFFTWLQYQNGFSFTRTTNIQKFLDDTHDRVSGIVFRITLSVRRSQNECSTPVVD